MLLHVRKNYLWFLVKNNRLKKEFNTRVALYTGLSSSFDPFGSQSFSKETPPNTTTKTQVDSVDSSGIDPFSIPQDVFSSNTYESAKQHQRPNSYGDGRTNNNNAGGDEKPISYEKPKILEPDYIDLTQESSANKNFDDSSTASPPQPRSSYEINNKLNHSKSFQQGRKLFYNKAKSQISFKQQSSQRQTTNLGENILVNNISSDRAPKLSGKQKLIDAIDEHGENWEYISKEIYNDEVGPEELETDWLKTKSFLKFQSSSKGKGKVYPFWTTKECFKLIDAMKACGDDWQKISIEWFNRERTPQSLQMKYENMFQIGNRENFVKSRQAFNQNGEIWKLASRDDSSKSLLSKWKKLNEVQSDIFYNTGQSQMEKTPALKTQKIMDKDQLARELGRELNLQWSNIVNLFKQRATSLEIHFNSLADFSWTKEENSTLFAAIKKFGTKDWEKILDLLPGKSLKNIQERCSNVLWEQQEVEAFDDAFKQYGSDWSKISKFVVTRSPGQCWSYWRITTGNDILEPDSNNRAKPVTRGIYRANVFIQFPNKETSQMSFVRRNTAEDFIPEKTVD